MKRLVPIFGLLIAGGALYAQSVVLTYETHGFGLDDTYVMRSTEYQNPGEAGLNRVWDFSGLQGKMNADGIVTNSLSEDNNLDFLESNLTVNEYGNRFFMKVDPNGMFGYGMLNSNGRQSFVHNQPYVKMKFPFAYGDAVAGEYGGKYLVNSEEYNFMGTYQVQADATGKVILPEGMQYENTLRVKTVREYQIEMSTPQKYQVITYRWYAQNVRYPVLVVQEVNYKSGESERQLSSRTVILSSDELNISGLTESGSSSLFSVFPNPAKEMTNLSFNLPVDSDVRVELYDLSGKKLSSLVEERVPAGNFNYEINLLEYGYGKGQFTVRALIDGQSFVETLIVQ